MLRHNAIVLGGHTTALYVTRSLGEAGARVAVLHTSALSETRFSRYCSQFLTVEQFSKERILEKIREIEKVLGPCVIVPTNDTAVRSLSEVLDDLGPEHVPLIPPWRISRAPYDKRMTYEYANRCGVPIPRTCFPNSIDAVREFADECRFPVVLKPTTTDRFRALVGAKAVQADDPGDLFNTFEQLSKDFGPGELLLQEFIRGDIRHFWHYGCVMHDLRPYFGYVISRKRQYPIDFGTATHAEIVPVAEVADFGARILREMGFWGAAEVQFKYDQDDDTYVLLDVNPRFWKSCAIAAHLGVNMPLLAYQLATGERPEIPSQDQSKRMIWCDILPDVFVAAREMLGGRVSFAEWIDSYRGQLIECTMSWRDPMPGLALIATAPLRYLKGVT